MYNSQNKRGLQVVLVVLIAVITLGIGYASISAINLIINGNATASVNDANFDVHFIPTADTPSLMGNVTPTGSASISGQDNKVALFDVGGMTKVGDYVIATYTIINNSNGIGADISLILTNSNPEYFKVTETVTDSQLQAGDTTTGTVKVEMIKTPIQDNVTTSVTGTLTATPIENAQAVGNNPVSKASDDPVSFAIDSWTTIKKAVQDNNTSLYHVGDTKIITIGANNYMVRLVNKSTGSNCGDNDTGYSQTACGFVVEFVDALAMMQMRDTGTNVGGYPSTLVYDYLNNTLYGQLSPELQSSIKPTRVISGHGANDSGNYTTTDFLYLLSRVEIHGSDSLDSAAGTTHQLEYYQNSQNSQNSGLKNYNGSSYNWWLRPACSSNSASFARSTVPQTSYDWTYYSATTQYVVAPAFRIG